MYSKSAIGQINVGYFSGPWSTTFIAQDGAILAFEDMEQALLQIVKRGDLNGINLKPISTYRNTRAEFSQVFRGT